MRNLFGQKTISKMSKLKSQMVKSYEEELRRFDWFYSFSDNHRSWVAGEREGARLRAKAEKYGSEFKQAYNEAHKAVYDVDGFGEWKPPYPEVWS